MLSIYSPDCVCQLYSVAFHQSVFPVQLARHGTIRRCSVNRVHGTRTEMAQEVTHAFSVQLVT